MRNYSNYGLENGNDTLFRKGLGVPLELQDPRRCPHCNAGSLSNQAASKLSMIALEFFKFTQILRPTSW
jgi:hypothetical protein